MTETRKDHTEQDEDGNPLYWNVHGGYIAGWKNATAYTATAQTETDLPSGGRWVVWQRQNMPASGNDQT
jgi:hypothetical protein